jgi:hypothetical protein
MTSTITAYPKKKFDPQFSNQDRAQHQKTRQCNACSVKAERERERERERPDNSRPDMKKKPSRNMEPEKLWYFLH